MEEVDSMYIEKKKRKKKKILMSCDLKVQYFDNVGNQSTFQKYIFCVTAALAGGEKDAFTPTMTWVPSSAKVSYL